MSTPNFWTDEAITLKAALMPWDDMWRALINDTAPPLFTLIEYFLLKIFPINEFVTRFPSMIFGVLTIYGIYLVSKDIFPYNKSYQNLITLFSIINPTLIYYSQEARAYSLFVCLSTFSIYFVLKLIDPEKRTLKNYVGLMIICTLGLYTHNLFLFIFLTDAIILGICYLDVKKIKQTFLNELRLILCFVLSFIAYLPWFPVVLNQSKTVSKGGFWLHLDPIHDLILILIHIFSGGQLTSSKDMILAEIIRYPKVYLATILLASMLMIIIFALIKLIREKILTGLQKKLFIVLLWTLVNFAIVYIYSFKTSFIHIRYMIYLIPSCIIMTIGIFAYFKSNILKVTLLLTIFISQIVLTFITYQNIPHSKADTKSLVVKVESVYNEGDLIVHPTAYSYYAFDLYSNLDSRIYDPDFKLEYYQGLAVLSEDDYIRERQIQTDSKQIFVVYLWGESKELKELRQVLENNYKKIDAYNYDGDLHLEIWQKTNN